MAAASYVEPEVDDLAIADLVVLALDPQQAAPARLGQAVGEPLELVAMPAIHLDVAFIHMNRADMHGNGQFLGPDLYFDDLFAMAGAKTFMSAEKIVPTDQFLVEGTAHTLRIPRIHVDGVVEAPRGAHFTECPPDYDRDEAFQREYAATAKDHDAWARFRADWLELESHEAYRAKLAEREA